ncbi:HNH endonuclease signature motif containing protein [Georgenia faecalis]|uniref:DUF222 domain-containing protein n=1 Tax=Georgenia faecalis TaxID=2483799 RepID=A0ABV9DAD7_9MICO|nr:HNH endonuclease signature motif containing protein [Georgenia faecalis]
MTTPVAEALASLQRDAAALAGADIGALAGSALTETLTLLEEVQARVGAVRTRVVAQIEADGTWALGGARSLPAWVREHTGRLEHHAARTVREARALRDHLPAFATAFSAGEITEDHVHVVVRGTTGSPACVTALSHPAIGEDWLLAQARALDAGRFHVVVKNWALRADPGAGDRGWKEETDREEFSLAKTLDGYHGRIWLTEANGALLKTALEASAGRRAKDDARSIAQRRAGALVDLVGATLDNGVLQPGARIRPHLAITATVETLTAIARAQRPRGAGGDDGGSTNSAGHARRESGDGDGGTGHGGDASPPALETKPVSVQALETISAALDYEALVGVAPALLDGSPIPFGLFARLACESRLHRVVFGADSEILDVGREERLFTRGQARGIIARDHHCQFPHCTAPPGQGEIHHSLWWYAHHGDTATKNGILLCRYHHTYVHQHELLIERHRDRWRFARSDGTTHGETPIARTDPPVRV